MGPEAEGNNPSRARSQLQQHMIKLLSTLDGIGSRHDRILPCWQEREFAASQPDDQHAPASQLWYGAVTVALVAVYLWL